MLGGKHGECRWDTPLCPSAVSECKAKAACTSLQSIIFDLVLISPFRRTCETAMHILPHLRLSKDAQIHLHKSFSEVCSLDIMMHGEHPTICKRLELWRWRRGRRRVPPQYQVMASKKLQLEVLGHWPVLGEDWGDAEKRFSAAFAEMEAMAKGRNVLIISHR